MRDFCLFDPSGVLWRIGQNSEWNNQRYSIQSLFTLEHEHHYWNDGQGTYW
jgi:hypothetical protein